MKIVCAWCGLPMGEKEPFDDKTSTHTICKTCADELCGQQQMYEKKHTLALNLVAMEAGCHRNFHRNQSA